MGSKILALALGLAEDAPEDQVFAKAAEAVSAGLESKKQFTKLSTDHTALVAEVEKQGFKVEGAKLSKVEPIKLDLQPDPADSVQVAEYKRRLREADAKDTLAAVTSIKDRVAKLGLSLKVAPALLPTVEELAGVRGELETMMLSKDGKGVEFKKCKEFGNEFLSLMEKLSSLGGTKLKAAGVAEPNEELDKKKGEEQVKAAIKLAQPEEESDSKE